MGAADPLSRNPVSSDPLKVTIGMPAYNGEAYIDRAIRSVVSQTYAHFHLVVSDDGSTDATWEILKGWSERDHRITPVRQDVNIGPIPNFSFVLGQADTEYFMWLAQDDWLAPNYLEELVRISDADEGCKLACGMALRVYPDGTPGKRRLFPDWNQKRRVTRVARLLARPEHTWGFGLFRTSEVREAQACAEECGEIWLQDRLVILHFLLNDWVRGSNDTVINNHKTPRSSQRYRPRTFIRQVLFVARYMRFQFRLLARSRLSLSEKILCAPWVLVYCSRTVHMQNYKRLIKWPIQRLVGRLRGKAWTNPQGSDGDAGVEAP